MTISALFPIDPKNPLTPSGVAVASNKFGRSVEVDTVVLRPYPSGEEFVVSEAEDFRRVLINTQSLSLWLQTQDPSSDEWNTWFHLNAHNARRMTLSVEKIISLIGNIERHELALSGLDWNSLEEPTWVDTQQPEALSRPKSDVLQPSLQFPETFIPSSELIALWMECLTDIAVAGGRKNINLALAGASPSERAHQFATMFRSTIGSFAQYLRYEQSGETRLLANGRISPAFQIALAEQFYIIPDKGARFLELLANDFLAALENGWKVEADWGRLRFSEDRGIELLLKSVEYFEDPDFVESEDVE